MSVLPLTGLIVKSTPSLRRKVCGEGEGVTTGDTGRRLVSASRLGSGAPAPHCAAAASAPLSGQTGPCSTPGCGEEAHPEDSGRAYRVGIRGDEQQDRATAVGLLGRRLDVLVARPEAAAVEQHRGCVPASPGPGAGLMGGRERGVRALRSHTQNRERERENVQLAHFIATPHARAPPPRAFIHCVGRLRTYSPPL